jgi:radical SAM protein with 4Fe4S-binding SPASM domain
MEGSPGSMSFDLFKKIIDEMAEYPGTALVPFFRGESMLHPQFTEMIAYAKNSGIGPIQFTTNATMLKNDLARTLIDLEIDFISFSIDSIDPNLYARIRKNGNLEEVLQNIEYFCEYKKNKAVAKPEVQVSVVRTDKSADGIESFVKYWGDKVDRVRVYEEHSKDGNFGSLSKLNDTNSSDRKPCHKPFTDMVIYWDGRVAVCNHDWDRPNDIGDVNHTSISQIWTGDDYVRIRKTHLEQHDLLEKLCKNCDHWKAFYRPQNQIGELYEPELDF